jgi:selenocysteine lyase/cysteine desulfurase
MTLSRRSMIVGTGATAAAGLGLAAGPAAQAAAAAASSTGAAGTVPKPPPGVDPATLAHDERYWRKVARQWRTTREVVNLENGYYGVMPEPVRRAYLDQIDTLNYRNTLYLRTDESADEADARARLAQAVGATPEEIALTRGATEALQDLIGGYHEIGAGQVALYSDLDYPSMQSAMEYVGVRRGAEVVRFDTPDQPTHDNILETYRAALDAHPNAKLLLVTHLGHRTGFVPPTREIVAMARERGVDTVVDAAHSWAHLDFGVDDLGADFVGFNLHKWLCAPLGVGMLYIRSGRLADIDPDYATPGDPDDISTRVHTGTTNIANVLTVPTAIEFHDRIGSANKAARLTYLRNYWVERARELSYIEIMTPDDDAAHGAITSFRVRGADNSTVPAMLAEQYGVWTVYPGGGPRGDCIRVTPTLYNSIDDLDTLVGALRRLPHS